MAPSRVPFLGPTHRIRDPVALVERLASRVPEAGHLVDKVADGPLVESLRTPPAVKALIAGMNHQGRPTSQQPCRELDQGRLYVPSIRSQVAFHYKELPTWKQVEGPRRALTLPSLPQLFLSKVRNHEVVAIVDPSSWCMQELLDRDVHVLHPRFTLPDQNDPLSCI